MSRPVPLPRALEIASRAATDGALQLKFTGGPPRPPQRPANALESLRRWIGVVLEAVVTPLVAADDAISAATSFLARGAPGLPAAGMGDFALGLPHAHLHPPSWIPPAPPIPLPPFGPILLGCNYQVLIGGRPAARVGDIGLSPTCGGLFAGFEIFTGSSTVFIGGMRAARLGDVTLHCFPPSSWSARGTIATLVAAAKAAMLAVMGAGIAAQIAGILADDLAEKDALAASDQAAAAGQEAVAAGQAAMAKAAGVASTMAAAQLAADAAALAFGAMMGKDPALGPPTGVIMAAKSTVLIGGLPMPSAIQLGWRALSGARRARARRCGRNRTSVGC